MYVHVAIHVYFCAYTVHVYAYYYTHVHVYTSTAKFIHAYNNTTYMYIVHVATKIMLRLAV